MLTTVIEALSTTECGRDCEISCGFDNGDGGEIAANGQLESGEVDYSTSFVQTWLPSMMTNTHPNTQLADTTDSIYASVAVGSDLFIVVDNPLSGSDLLISSNGKTGLVKTFDSLDSSTLTEFGNKLYFSAADANGCTLWESDGTPSGTAMVKDTDPSSTSNSNCPEKLTVVGSIGFFTGYDSTNGEALWKTDGTTAGTVMVKDTYTTGMTNGPARLTKVGSVLFFYGYDNTAGGSLWKSDGTTAGTVMVKDTHTSSTGWGPAKLTEVGTSLYFVVVLTLLQDMHYGGVMELQGNLQGKRY